MNCILQIDFFGASMNCEHEKRKKWPVLLKKQYFESKNREKTRFSGLSSSGR
jgi:hypothetical protein